MKYIILLMTAISIFSCGTGNERIHLILNAKLNIDREFNNEFEFMTFIESQTAMNDEFKVGLRMVNNLDYSLDPFKSLYSIKHIHAKNSTIAEVISLYFNDVEVVNDDYSIYIGGAKCNDDFKIPDDATWLNENKINITKDRPWADQIIERCIIHQCIFRGESTVFDVKSECDINSITVYQALVFLCIKTGCKLKMRDNIILIVW